MYNSITNKNHEIDMEIQWENVSPFIVEYVYYFYIEVFKMWKIIHRTSLHLENGDENISRNFNMVAICYSI